MSRRGVNASDSRRFSDWIDRAYDDLVSAQLLMSDDRCYLSCAFHCQQCIEKALKAFLLVRLHRLIDGHNLTWLCKQAIRENNAFQEWLDESAALGDYYISTRYPTDFEFELSLDEVEKAYRMAREMYRFICDEVYEEAERTRQIK